MGFKSARQKAGYTARQAANQFGVSMQTIYNWEAGSYNPETSKLPEISDFYGCTVDELLKDNK